MKKVFPETKKVSKLKKVSYIDINQICFEMKKLIVDRVEFETLWSMHSIFDRRMKVLTEEEWPH